MKGYWGKFGSDSTVTIVGGEVLSETTVVCAGWNLIGGISDTVDTASVTSTPPGIRVSPYYAFSVSGYSPVAVLLPGKAHWVKTSASGELRFGAAARSSAEEARRRGDTR